MIEAGWQSVAGIVLSYLFGFIIYPLCGVQVTGFSNIKVTLSFYVLSLVRQYVIRRWRNK